MFVNYSLSANNDHAVTSRIGSCFFFFFLLPPLSLTHSYKYTSRSFSVSHTHKETGDQWFRNFYDYSTQCSVHLCSRSHRALLVTLHGPVHRLCCLHSLCCRLGGVSTSITPGRGCIFTPFSTSTPSHLTLRSELPSSLWL